MCPPVDDDFVGPGEGSCRHGASTIPGSYRRLKRWPTQLWWPDFAQGCVILIILFSALNLVLVLSFTRSVDGAPCIPPTVDGVS
jgi:hypothetical protein